MAAAHDDDRILDEVLGRRGQILVYRERRRLGGALHQVRPAAATAPPSRVLNIARRSIGFIGILPRHFPK